MQEEDQNNDSIEQLFQKKADEFHIPFRKEDWNRLEKRLELHDLQIAYRRKFRLAVAALILFISSVGYFTVEHNIRLNQLTDQIQGVTPQESITNESPEVTIHDNRETFSPRSESGLQDPGQPLEATPNGLERLTLADRPEFAWLQQSGETRDRDHQQSQLIANFHHIPVSPASLPIHLPVEYIEVRMLIPASVLERSDNFSYLFDKKTSAPFKGALYTHISEERSSSLSLGSIPLEGTPNTNFFKERSSGLSLGLTYSPDFSRADFTAPGNGTGYRLGMKGEYQISEHLFLQAGLLLSKVHYTASGQQYNPPDYWNNGIVPDETNAICMILDIPIGLKYNLFNFNSSRFFSTAALSSYFMLSEEYSFNYSSEFTDLQESLEINNGSGHLLNHLNLSFGYEYDLTPSITIRTEPFLYLPLRGVGWGDVRFYSMGGFVSLNLQM